MNIAEALIPALEPRGRGHQFVCYADSCSGIPGTPEEAAFARVNAVLARLRPQPQFICFPGDEVLGLTSDAELLSAQWRHWFEKELSWLDRQAIPLYHAPANHTTYDKDSEAVFKTALAHLPRNGPAGQEGLSYFVRREDLLLVSVNTASSQLGGEGQVETEWLSGVLSSHADARYKLVMGHHPAHPVLGRSSPYELNMTPEDARHFWAVLAQHRVFAYICSHILTYDIQIHDGVLQILTGGAGRTREFLHLIQMAIDPLGLRYQVLDASGKLAKWLAWPLPLPPADSWNRLELGVSAAPAPGALPSGAAASRPVVWQFSGIAAAPGNSEIETFLSGWDNSAALPSLWIGLLGRERRLCVQLAPTPGRSPTTWLGPPIQPELLFTIQICAHSGMGPGGILWRYGDNGSWSSFSSSSNWGSEKLTWPANWSIGHDRRGPGDRAFRGRDLKAAYYEHLMQL